MPHLQQQLANEQDGVYADQGMGVLETGSHGSHVTVNHRRVPSPGSERNDDTAQRWVTKKQDRSKLDVACILHGLVNIQSVAFRVCCSMPNDTNTIDSS